MRGKGGGLGSLCVQEGGVSAFRGGGFLRGWGGGICGGRWGGEGGRGVCVVRGMWRGCCVAMGGNMGI